MKLLMLLLAIGLALPTSAGLVERAPPTPSSEISDEITHRRGIAFNRPEYVKPFWITTTHASWCYNWDSPDISTNTQLEASIFYQLLAR
jgi:hypothetical protein